MKRIDELGISPAPWDCHKQFVTANDDGSVVAATNMRDASLISAAPDMYKAIYHLLMAADYGISIQRQLDECRAALAKASGEEEAK